MGKKILIMAGGTGGHIYPGLAVAAALQKLGWEVRWLGTADKMEATLVPNAGIAIDYIPITGLRSKGWRAWLAAPYRIIKAIYAAKKVINHYQFDVVLGMGGYVAGPGGIAAWLCRIPLVIHEQNAVAGLTNRALSYFATTILQAFPNAFKQAAVVGNPVREILIRMPPPAQRYATHDGPLRILVMGGSQGATILNMVIPQVAARLDKQIMIWHQTGKAAFSSVQQHYQQAKIDTETYHVTPFIGDMVAAYNWADIAICRAGALTVSELAAIGLPAILVPFEHQDKQQYLNAQYLINVDGAKMITQATFTVERVVTELKQLSRTKLLQMAENAHRLAAKYATKHIVAAITQLTEKQPAAY